MEAIARRAAAPAFMLALFASAALIFVLQPLFARMVTPLLGGSPAVWNTSMAFFQGALLVGYVYAHALARVQDLRVQAMVHAVVLALAWLVLPLQVSDALGPPNSDHPALWLVGVLTLSVGAPFAAAAATAPLLQSWYARTGRADANDPYYLYAASNLGSFVGLLAYPILIEPLLGAQAQSAGWSGGYALVFVLIGMCAITAIGARGPAPAADAAGAAPSWRQRLYWMGAAAAPSALTLGVTLHISTDVASAPMLWVVPLALYLATFVIAFARGGERLRPIVALLQPFAVALLILCYTLPTNWVAVMGGNLVGFFFSALACHLALSAARPHVGRLTEFYFWVSLGGVTGGALAAFVAPTIFNNVYEYPLALAAAALFLPRGIPLLPRLADVAIAAAAAMCGIALLLMVFAPHHAVLIAGAVGAAGALVAAGWGAEHRALPLRIGFLASAGAAAALLAAAAAMVDSVFVEEALPHQVDAVDMAGFWGPLSIVVSFVALIFCVHAAVQPRRGERTLVDSVGDAGAGVGIVGFTLMITLALLGESLNARMIVIVALMGCAIGLFLNRTRPIVMAALVMAAFFIVFLDDGRSGRIIRQERSFFGVMRTISYEPGEESGLPSLRVLLHGTTTHGAQLVGDEFAQIPLTYYNRDTALGESILAGLAASEDGRLALIGLGTGSTACLMRPEDQLTIFEIDPMVLRLSNSADGDFTFVPQCQPNARVELGDARLQIAEEPDASFDVVVVDAFSSDAIPAHLLTREALALYLSKAGARGIVVLHLSNRNLALVSEAARVADSIDAPHLWRISGRVSFELAPVYGGLAASVMIVAKDQQALDALPLRSAEWRAFPAPPGQAWSDDYINLPRALWDSLSGVEECRIYPDIEGCSDADAEPEAGSEPE